MALWVGLAASPALSCSPVSGYVRPSNFELVQMADAIVVARPVSARRTRDAQTRLTDSVVTFRVSEALKGNLAGEIALADMWLGRVRPSDPDDIAFSHPDGHGGPCNRVTFQKGRDYLLFLRKTKDGYDTFGYPFSRESEDYAGPQSLWARTVRAYLDIQREAAPMDQLARLETLRAELAAGKAPGDRARAEDITSHLGSISPWKPTALLVDALERARQGRPPRYPPRDGGFDEERSGAHAISELVMRGLGEEEEASPAKPARSPEEERILEALIKGEHPDAAPVFEPFLKPDATPGDFSLGLRYLAANHHTRRAYDLIEARAEAILAAPPGPDLEEFLHTAWRVLEVNEDPPAWRADPYIAGRWPPLALRLTTYAEAAGTEADFEETLLTLLKDGEYRVNPGLTLSVSGHDDAVIQWADKELQRPEVLAAPRGEAWDDPLILPLRISLRWHGLSSHVDAAPLIAVACAGSAERQMLFREWGRTGSLFGLDTLHRLALTPGMTDADRDALADALAVWRARYLARIGSKSTDETEATAKIARREPLTSRDIAPAKPPKCPAS